MQKRRKYLWWQYSYLFRTLLIYLIYKYIVKIIRSGSYIKIMNLKETILQRQEVSCNGCCMPRFTKQQKDVNIIVPSRVRVYSQPKESKSRKIEIVTARKGYSQGKETNHTNRSVSHEKITTYTKKEQFSSPNSRVIFGAGPTTPSSKSTAPMVNFNNNMRISPAHYRKDNVQALSPCKIPPFNKKPQIQTNKLNSANFLYISQISLVSEEFISQGSAMNIANLINSSRQGNTVEPKNEEWHRKMQNWEDKRNPVQKFMNRKKYQQKAENRKKKIVL